MPMAIVVPVGVPGLSASLASPKSSYFNLTRIVHHQVAGLEVAMHDSGGVGRGQRICCLYGQAQHLIDL
jgi:hypothetical protein